MAQGQARKGTRAGKKRHKGRQEKAQRQARTGTRAGKKRHKGRQENAQRQDMKGTNEASKEGLKGRPGNLKRWAGGQGMTQK